MTTMSPSRRRGTALFVLLLMLCPISGCIFPEKTVSESEGSDQESPSSEPSTLSTQCMEFRAVERCWTLLVPGNVSTEQPVPLVLDLHGHGATTVSYTHLTLPTKA